MEARQRTNRRDLSNSTGNIHCFIFSFLSWKAQMHCFECRVWIQSQTSNRVEYMNLICKWQCTVLKVQKVDKTCVHSWHGRLPGVVWICPWTDIIAYWHVSRCLDMLNVSEWRPAVVCLGRDVPAISVTLPPLLVTSPKLPTTLSHHHLLYFYRFTPRTRPVSFPLSTSHLWLRYPPVKYCPSTLSANKLLSPLWSGTHVTRFADRAFTSIYWVKDPSHHPPSIW